MQHITELKVICPFCGRVNIQKEVNDDGFDWLGHHRSFPETEIIEPVCVCEIGKLKKKLPKIRKMCQNCKYNQNGYCVNKKEIEKIQNDMNFFDNFDIKMTSLKIKKLQSSCDFHELNYEIFKTLLSD